MGRVAGRPARAGVSGVTDSLLQQLDSATGPDRELDGEFALFLGWKRVGKGHAHWTNPAGKSNQHVPFFTDSIDDLLDLMREKLPGWNIANFWDAADPKNRPWCGCSLRRDERYKVVSGKGANTLPLALAIAIVKALEQ